MDRFISTASSGVYHASTSSRASSTMSPFRPKSTPVSLATMDTKTPENAFLKTIEQILGFSGQRVLKFKSKKRKFDPYQNELENYDEFHDSPSLRRTSPAAKKHKISTKVPYKVSEAPGLRNDFYSNLVSWSAHSSKSAVGSGTDVYLWDETSGAVPLPSPEYDMVTAVSFSPDNSLAVGYKTGKIGIYCQETQHLICEYYDSGKGVCCILWLPNATSNPETHRFYAGNESGEVKLFETCDDVSRSVHQFHCQDQQICGSALSNSGRQLAVGSNDNSCCIWDITDPLATKSMHVLPHKAAVKAVAYCPWSSSLLATGGGSKDKILRFWHTDTGTLLKQLNTGGQITSILWAPNKKQLCVTFGFSGLEHPSSATLYTYPGLQSLFQIPALQNSRVSSGVLSPDSKKICIATNDQTVRFYAVWNNEKKLVKECQQSGSYGSDSIESYEGVDKSYTVIR